MASLPPFRQIQFNQVPGAPSWFAAFLQSLNQFCSAVYDMANRSVTLGDNIPAQFKTLTYQVPAAGYPALTTGVLSFASTLRAKPQVVVLAQAQVTQGTPGTAAISLNQWTNQAGNIQLDSIAGLQANNTYSLTFLVL